MKHTLNTYKSTLDYMHLNKYQYVSIDRKNGKTYVNYICPIHGNKTQEINIHKNGYGCTDCAMEAKKEKLHYKFSLSKEEVINKAKKIHGDKYDYSQMEYYNSNTPIKIICHKIDEFGNEHGIFYQTLANHIGNKEGCPICGKTHGMTLERFINKANKKHNFKYTYKKSIYKNAHTKVLITCPEHGDFLQTPNEHLDGCGCPKCKSSHLENETRKLLIEKNINFEEQKKFDWLVFNKNGKMKLDFYLPDYNTAIECQGEQHFYAIEYFHGKETFEKAQKRDKTKKKLCEKNNIKLEYINYFDNIEKKLNKILKNAEKK